MGKITQVFTPNNDRYKELNTDINLNLNINMKSTSSIEINADNRNIIFGYNNKADFTIPKIIGVTPTSIGVNTFNNCTSLTSVTIPDSVTSIGSNTFYNCINLTSITIPDSVTSIGNNAFYGCIKLNTVYYTGTKEEWNKITIGIDNTSLLNATKVFNYQG